MQRIIREWSGFAKTCNTVKMARNQTLPGTLAVKPSSPHIASSFSTQLASPSQLHLLESEVCDRFFNFEPGQLSFKPCTAVGVLLLVFPWYSVVATTRPFPVAEILGCIFLRMTETRAQFRQIIEQPDSLKPNFRHSYFYISSYLLFIYSLLVF